MHPRQWQTPAALTKTHMTSMLDNDTITDALTGMDCVEQFLIEAETLPSHDPAELEKGREAFRQLCGAITAILKDEVESELVHSPEGRRLLDRAASLAAAAEIHGITSTETF